MFEVFLPVVVVLVAATMAPVGAQQQNEETPPLLLKDAIAEALEHNPELVALRREVDAMGAASPQAGYLGAPTFETQIWGWPVTTLNPARTDMYMFMAEQELPGRGKRAARVRVAERETDLSRQQVGIRAN
jgi:cobalt-zinc-cadmium efflux system outer membrane protein